MPPRAGAAGARCRRSAAIVRDEATPRLTGSAAGAKPAGRAWLADHRQAGRAGSTQVVGAVKRALREGGYPKVKVGHGGTLDPLASGVLPIALGEATKLAGRMLDADKVYEFTIGFGAETDTLDAEGEVVATSDRRPTSAEVEAVLPRFTGAIEQVPPAYSALKVDGQARLRSRARRRGGRAEEPRRVDDPRRSPSIGSGAATRSTLTRPRLQGHLYPQPRPRHRPRPGYGRPRHHVAADARPARSPSNRRFRWTNWAKPLRAAPLKNTSCR